MNALGLMFHLAVGSAGAKQALLDRIELVESACRSMWAPEASVPCGVLHAIVFVESGYQIRNPGAPLAGCKPYSSDNARQARCLAVSMAHRMRDCGGLRRGLVMYRSGRCTAPRALRRRAARYVARVLRIAARLRD